MTDTTTTTEHPADLTQPASEPGADLPQVADATEQATFPAEYVKQLRHEAATHRVKARRVDQANSRLVHAYAATDGRLVNPDDLDYTETLLDTEGVVDPSKVTDAITALVTARPYLAKRTPQQPITQGVQPDQAHSPGLFDLIRERF